MGRLIVIVVLVLFTAAIVGIAGIVFRVSSETWDTATMLAAGAVSFAVVSLATGAAVNLYLRGRALLEVARARRETAEARQQHGWQPDTYNVLVLSNEAGDVMALPAGDNRGMETAIDAGYTRVMAQQAMMPVHRTR